MPKPIVQNRPIYEIAEEIVADHEAQGKTLYFGLVPYIGAMRSLNRITDVYIAEDATSILTYALGNMQTWRGETARRVKAEIKAMLPW